MEENYPNKYYDSPEAIEHKKKMEKLKPAVIPFKPLNNQMQNQGMGRPAIRPNIKPVIDSAKFKLPHATNWIEVGASAYKNDATLKASFSNYGKFNVDVFAPGFLINSTVPDSKYEELDGTSMAAPVVSGLAALILSYYPELTPQQVREIIMKSVSKVQQKVKLTNERGENVKASFSELCVSGGIVNAYEALKLAASYIKKK